jgi:2-polyprenyl-3-methyl-5-hydroxy-6-metoxy-1,4-benzoquinol methylase
MERTTARIPHSVQALFNAKAATWPSKYGPGASLHQRCDTFMRRLVHLCPASGPVLDFGCGTGDISRAVADKGYEVTACDIAEAMIAVARFHSGHSQIQWVFLNPGWTGLPFKSGEFACVLASSVFEYLDDLESSTKEMARVLQPGGALLFSVPNPFNKIRRIEAGIRLLVPQPCVSVTAGRFVRIHGFLSYLRLSRNRFTGAEWKALLARASLRPVEEREFSESAWRRQANAPMLLLAARKTTT